MLTMRGGSQAGNNGVKMARPPPVPPRPDRSLVADALARSRKVPAPVLPPGLKKDLSPKIPETLPPQETPKPSTNKLPSPKLNGLSRVKSFIRDVMTEKKSSEDKKHSKDDILNKNGGVKSHIPIPQSPKIKGNEPPSLNYPQEESVKNQSSQSVVRTLCSVIMNNSDKDKDKAGELKPGVRVIKSNSFAEKAVPVRRAPPPPISPKPTKKQIEDKISRSQAATDSLSMRKLSASCEELNNPPPRPIVYQSNKLLSSPMFLKKCIPPSLPSGKPPPPAKKKSYPNSPSESETSSGNAFPFKKNAIPAEKNDTFENKKIPANDRTGLDLSENDKKCLTEKLISEIISAKNDALLSKYHDNKLVNNDVGSVPNKLIDNTLNTGENGGALLSAEDIFISNVISDEIKVTSSCTEDRVNLVNISYNSSKAHKDSVSDCSSDSSGSGGSKTILFINSDTSQTSDFMYHDEKAPVFKPIQNFPNKPNNNNAESHKNRLNDMSNHELLISELQGMRREAFDDRVNKRQREPSSEMGSSSPDSISAETQNIQHSDWLQLEDNGQQVRYSSCQILIEDPSSPVDDSGICLDDNFYSADSSYSLSPSLVSRLKEQYFANLKMSSLQGLPPLPKSLSGFNVAEGGPGQGPPPGQPPPPPVPARTPASLRYGQARAAATEPPPPPIALNGDTHGRPPRKPTTLDTQLAVLKREMVSLCLFLFSTKVM